MTYLKVDDLNVLSEETLITPNQLKVAVPGIGTCACHGIKCQTRNEKNFKA